MPPRSHMGQKTLTSEEVSILSQAPSGTTLEFTLAPETTLSGSQGRQITYRPHHRVNSATTNVPDSSLLHEAARKLVSSVADRESAMLKGAACSRKYSQMSSEFAAKTRKILAAEAPTSAVQITSLSPAEFGLPFPDWRSTIGASSLLSPCYVYPMTATDGSGTQGPDDCDCPRCRVAFAILDMDATLLCQIKVDDPLEVETSWTSDIGTKPGSKGIAALMERHKGEFEQSVKSSVHREYQKAKNSHYPAEVSEDDLHEEAWANAKDDMERARELLGAPLEWSREADCFSDD